MSGHGGVTPIATVGWGSTLSLCGCYRPETLLLTRPSAPPGPLSSKVVSQAGPELGTCTLPSSHSLTFWCFLPFQPRLGPKSHVSCNLQRKEGSMTTVRVLDMTADCPLWGAGRGGQGLGSPEPLRSARQQQSPELSRPQRRDGLAAGRARSSGRGSVTRDVWRESRARRTRFFSTELVTRCVHLGGWLWVRGLRLEAAMRSLGWVLRPEPEAGGDGTPAPAPALGRLPWPADGAVTLSPWGLRTQAGGAAVCRSWGAFCPAQRGGGAQPPLPGPSRGTETLEPWDHRPRGPSLSPEASSRTVTLKHRSPR